MFRRSSLFALFPLLFVMPAAAEAARPVWVRAAGSPGAFRLDRADLVRVLADAPLELTAGAVERAVLVTLPMPDGRLSTFRVQDSPVMPPSLEAKYGIRTYAARGVDDPATIARFSLGPSGFHALILAPEGAIEIGPNKDEPDSYVSVRTEDDPRAATSCVAEDSGLPEQPKTSGASPFLDNAGTVSLYRLAASATAEFTAQNGGTVASAFEAITNVINGVNLAYRRDLGIHLYFVEGNDQLIQTQPTILLPSQDLVCEGGGCTNVDCLLTGNACLVSGLIGFANYDVGIVFDATNATGGASGVAEIGVVCGNLKGRGATGGTSIDLTAHELGHMFGGHHTFNSNSGGSCANAGQRDANWAYEPGSGSTIMSYAGTCGASDLHKGSRDMDFHADNVRDMLEFIQVGGGASCVDHAFSGNYGPIIQSLPGTRTVPASTPFLLKVDAYDPNDDTVTYSFDESDVGTASPPEGDDGSRPIYRVYRPSESSERSFPSYQYVLNNDNVPPATLPCAGGPNCLSGETLHSTSRTMQFSIILRDGVDGVNLAGTTIIVDGNSGPFGVTAPIETTVWTQGTNKTVTWNVAGTNAGAVNTPNVRILLSTDNGATWPHVLANSTPNDGSQAVTLPFVTTFSARIKVEGVNNYFYDVSKSFRIRDLAVDTNSDSGPGSLRQAILDANDYAFGATIPFRFTGGGLRSIIVLSQLPTITKPIAIDAWEIGGPEYTGTPLLQLIGNNCPPILGVPCDGLVVQSDNVFINGIAVNYFAGNGIVLRGAGAYGAVVQNNHIGIDPGGTIGAGNGLSGVLMDGGYGDPAYGNYIGQNVISGNKVGVTITGASANGNTVAGNRIGTDRAGTARIPNLDDGVRIVGAPNTRVGQPGLGNVIAGNGTVSNGFVNRYADAIEVSGAAATGTIIQGNLLGLDATGTTGMYNTEGNIRIVGAPNTLVGGTVAGARNVVGDDGTVNFNFHHCVLVSGAGATGTVIQGNHLGTDVTGTLDRGCRGAGVYVEGAPGVQIGGTTAAARNVISGNNNYGGVFVTAGASGTMIQGNYIGTNAAGTAAVPNNHIGITLITGANTIGGTAPGAGNVISGNAQRGIDLDEPGTSGNIIQGNFIGTNAAGTAAIGNGTSGISIERAPNNLIGGPTAAARNVISGNGGHGVYIAGSDGSMAPGNVIQGNYIGTDVTGNVGVGNGVGIELYYVRDATVTNNVISAGRNNAGMRLYSFGLNTSGILVQGNKIGTNAAGTAPLGNAGEGIWGAISGTASIIGNVIAASGLDGISLGQGSFTIQGNSIGTDVTGTLDLRNTWSGIGTTSPAACLIGGTAPGQGNVIAFSAPANTGTNHAGIRIGGAATGQTVRGNRIFSNTGLGIELHFSGVTPNDACDADTGQNGQQNFPVLTASNQSGSSTHVTGTVNSKATTVYQVDFYASPSCDVYGNGEGATYLGSTAVTTDGACNGSFDLVLPVPSTGVVTATATDPLGSTSEFSACRAVGPSPVAEVPGVGWASKTELTWATAAGATGYRVLRGVAAALPDLLDVDPDSCTKFTGAALTTGPILTETPAPATKYYWYLVVGSNGIDDGPFGAATAGPRIANPSGVCP